MAKSDMLQSKLTMDEQKLEKLARMEHSGVPRKQIATVFKLSEGRITQIIDTPEYQEVAAAIAAETFEQDQLINQGWDGIEALGLTRVMEALQVDPDPEFALRAAMAANKAGRKGLHQNQPISTQQSMKAVIELRASFLEQTNGMLQVISDEAIDASVETSEPHTIDHVDTSNIEHTQSNDTGSDYSDDNQVDEFAPRPKEINQLSVRETKNILEGSSMHMDKVKFDEKRVESMLMDLPMNQSNDFAINKNVDILTKGDDYKVNIEKEVKMDDNTGNSAFTETQELMRPR